MWWDRWFALTQILYTHTVPFVLKKHSPLLYTDKHGTLEFSNNSKAKSTPPAVFAISETKKKKQCTYLKTATKNKISTWDKNQNLTLFLLCNVKTFACCSSFVHTLSCCSSIPSFHLFAPCLLLNWCSLVFILTQLSAHFYVFLRCCLSSPLRAPIH